MAVRILGLSAFYHDSAAALVIDGDVVAAAQEERFSRLKHDARFPRAAIEYCLAEGGISISDLDHIVFYEKPFLKFERLIETYLAFAPRGFRSFRLAIPLWLREKLFQKRLLLEELARFGPRVRLQDKLLFSEHHGSHAASAFFPSPFDEAAVITIDGVGEWTTTSVGIGRGNRVEILREMHFPHSLGLLYSAFTAFAGFTVNSGEYKLMGLAPYGVPRYAQRILEHLIDLKQDGSFHLDLDYFDYCTGLRMTTSRFHELFECEPRTPEAPIRQIDMDMAASIQTVLEEAVIRIARHAAAETGSRRLCLAGGVALNCVANGKLLRDGCFDEIWVQPSAGDAGAALGAALAAYHLHLDAERTTPARPDAMKGSLLGPSFSQKEIETRLIAVGACFEVCSNDDDLITAATEYLAQEFAVGWFQGRMEFGPRALGARSILADPRSPSMQRTLNLKVKFRESFRPFAPSILREHLTQWFDMDADSPYMLLVANVAESRKCSMPADEQGIVGIDRVRIVRSQIPAVTHVDYSARIQTVHMETNPLYHQLLTRFYERTGCPVLVNTSFNVRGEPIVCTPEDAFRCFMGSSIDALIIGRCILEKTAQTGQTQPEYARAFALD